MLGLRLYRHRVPMHVAREAKECVLGFAPKKMVRRTTCRRRRASWSCFFEERVQHIGV